MVSKVRKYVGTVHCWNPKCKREIPVTAGGEGGNGALSLSCGFCGAVIYVKPGTKAMRDAGSMVRAEEDDSAGQVAEKPAGVPSRVPAAAGQVAEKPAGVPSRVPAAAGQVMAQPAKVTAASATCFG